MSTRPMLMLVLKLTRTMLLLTMGATIIVGGAVIYSIFRVQKLNFATMNAGDLAALVVMAAILGFAAVLWVMTGRVLRR